MSISRNMTRAGLVALLTTAALGAGLMTTGAVAQAPAAQAVDGVASVSVDVFRRQGQSSNAGLLAGKLTFERLEIPRLDNDPDFPDRGRLRLNLRGGT